MAIIGLPKSPSFIPVARHKARAPAMLRPCVVVADLNLGIKNSRPVRVYLIYKPGLTSSIYLRFCR